LVVEDAPAGLEAAHAAGMKAIAITSTFPASDLTRADAIVNGLVEIRVRNLSGLSLEVAVTRAAS
jgi:sugar-phosphatase